MKFLTMQSSPAFYLLNELDEDETCFCKKKKSHFYDVATFHMSGNTHKYDVRIWIQDSSHIVTEHSAKVNMCYRVTRSFLFHRIDHEILQKHCLSKLKTTAPSSSSMVHFLHRECPWTAKWAFSGVVDWKPWSLCLTPL